jgi:hypothetical protein
MCHHYFSRPLYKGANMIKAVKAKYSHFQLSATLHKDQEHILQAGNWNRTAFKIANTKWATFEVIDIWPQHPLDSQRDVLRQFQKMLFQGSAAALGPDIFCHTLHLDPDIKATELRFDVYNDIARQLKNVLGKWVLDDMQFCGMAMGLIVEMRKDGIDCGMDLDKGAV